MVYVQEILVIMKACVVIPTYNESRTIANLVRQLKKQDLDILIIDDGSSDNTAGIARETGAIVLRNTKNEGKGISLVRGFNYVLAHNFDAVITMDGDGQHSPGDIPYFMRLAEYSDSKVFIGNRMSRVRNMPALRFLTNKFMSWLISGMIKQRIPDTQCGFRLIKKEVLERIALKAAKFEIESELLIKAARLGFKIESLPINTIYTGEKSRINPFSDTLRFVRFIIKQMG